MVSITGFNISLVNFCSRSGLILASTRATSSSAWESLADTGDGSGSATTDEVEMLSGSACTETSCVSSTCGVTASKVSSGSAEAESDTSLLANEDDVELSETIGSGVGANGSGAGDASQVAASAVALCASISHGVV